MMINVETVRNLILALLAIIAVAGAISWWLIFSRDSAPPVSALFAACESSVPADFDFVTTMYGNQNLGTDDTIVTATYDVQVAGEAFYLHFTIGERSQEVIYIDDVVYEKNLDSAWKLANPQRKMDITTILRRGGYSGGGLETDNPLCPEIAGLGRSNEKMVSEIGPGHFRLTRTGVGAPEGSVEQGNKNSYITEGLDVTWDYWINEDGQLLKTRELITLTGNTEAGQVEVTTTISGVGERNVIEAPI